MRKVAYEGYWYKGYACGYGAFYSIIGLLGEKYGAPYNQFPFSMLEANKGGIFPTGAPSAAPCTVLLRPMPCSGAARNAPPWSTSCTAGTK